MMMKFAWHEKRRRGSAPALVILSFAVLIYLILPMGKAAFETVFALHLRERAIAVADASVFSIAADIDSVAFSRKRIELPEDPLKYIVDSMGLLEIRHAEFSLDGSVVKLRFTFESPAVFSDRTSVFQVEADYDFEILNEPTYE